MRSETFHRWTLTIICFVSIVTNTWSQGTTAVYYKQTFMDGSTPIDSQIVSSPAPFALIHASSRDTSIYTVESTYTLDALKLGTTAFIGVSGNIGDTPSNWKTIEATATATSVLQQFVTVQGLNMDNGQTGTVEFNWTLDGNTQFTQRDVRNTSVTSFTSSTLLKANVPGSGGVPFAENWSWQPGGASIKQDYPVNSQVFSYTVPFMAGTELFVDFTLFSQVSFAAEVVDTSPTGPGGGQIFAQLFSKFGDTARLESVVVLDDSGIKQENFTMLPVNGPEWMCNSTGCVSSIPEPGSFVMLGLLGCVAAGVAIIKRRRVSR